MFGAWEIKISVLYRIWLAVEGHALHVRWRVECTQQKCIGTYYVDKIGLVQSIFLKSLSLPPHFLLPSSLSRVLPNLAMLLGIAVKLLSIYGEAAAVIDFEYSELKRAQSQKPNYVWACFGNLLFWGIFQICSGLSCSITWKNGLNSIFGLIFTLGVSGPHARAQAQATFLEIWMMTRAHRADGRKSIASDLEKTGKCW